ncbi:unnamed protein product [Phytophthora lilii]|uniref:Unnamed protein product n=1 Tax=Phytophthora lilii TaxID=2077276 RepID=A0A9W6U4D6_9STRA|nr:unnamed protein product [Phytophthora lilii]
MESDASAVNADAGAPFEMAAEQPPTSDAPVGAPATATSDADVAAAAQETEGDAAQQLETPEESAATQPVEGEGAAPSEVSEDVATDAQQEDIAQQEDVVMAEPVETAESATNDAAATVPAESADADPLQQEGGEVVVSDVTDSDEKDESMDTPTQLAAETAMTEEATTQEEEAVEPVPVDAPPSQVDSADTTASVKLSSASAKVETEDEAEAAAPPTHNESEYDPSLPSIDTASVPHGEDEYDPANPSPAGTPVASNAAHDSADHHQDAEQEEYDPDHPSIAASAATHEPAAMEVEQTSASTANVEQPTVTPAKRKVDDEPNGPSDPIAKGDAELKRPRIEDDNKSNPHDADHNHGRHRRGSGDSISSHGSSSSKHKHRADDHKGLSAAAWDRLMDFQTSGEFRVTQVSRAAFASVGAMPEFAQIAIIARFVRTPMRDVRDKNGQLMRIYREYQKENPQVAALQPVDAFISDYKSDPGLFRFGYAPPQPATGISNVQVPYQHDQPEEESSVRNSPQPARGAPMRPEPEQRQQKGVDEFGRAVHQDKPSVNDLNPTAPSQRSAVDPRLASRSRQGPPSPVQQAPRATAGPRAEDPRRRDQPHPQSTSGAGRDPRRRSAQTNQMSPRGSQPGAPRAAGASDLYERLPAAVKAVVDSMRREGRLQESLNDNVITRLLHLPERVALQAVENLSNVDLSQVENLQGFLVGIINRVNEKAIASEKQQQHRPQAQSPRGHPQSALQRGGGYAAAPQGGSVLGGPPQGGRLNGNNGVNAAGYRGQPAPMTAGPGPALYERPYEAPQDPRDPRRRQPAPQGAPQQYGGAVRGPPPVGAGRGPPIGMPSFTALPISVQNHIHSLVANRTLSSLEELGGKCYEVLGQLSEPLANQVLSRFAGANLSNVRNKSGFLIGVVKRARQEYGFN